MNRPQLRCRRCGNLRSATAASRSIWVGVGLDRRPQVAAQAGLQADLAGRLALEEALTGPWLEVARVVAAARVQRASRACRSCVTSSTAPRLIVAPVLRRRRPRRRSADVADVVAADLGRLAGRQPGVALVVEGRRRGDADEQHRHPGVHDVAAVATAVAAHEREQRGRRRVAGHARRAPAPRQNSWATTASTKAPMPNIEQGLDVMARPRRPGTAAARRSPTASGTAR